MFQVRNMENLLSRKTVLQIGRGNKDHLRIKTCFSATTYRDTSSESCLRDCSN